MAMADVQPLLAPLPVRRARAEPARLKRIGEWQHGDALLLAVTDEPHDRFASASLIAIDFPSFSDGRGLSLAVLLRTRLGFTGELRAVGALQPDLVHYLWRCGFDSVELHGECLRLADIEYRGVLAPYSDYYQASVLEPQPAYRRIRRGA